MRHTLFAAALTVLLPAVASAQLQVVTTGPALNEVAPPTASVSIEFDRAVDTSTVSFTTVRVFGIGSGPARGTFSFSNGNKTVTLTPNRPFHAGEIVYVNLSHDLKAADTSALRAAGWAWQFSIQVTASAGTFQEVDKFSNRSGGGNTRIYGASSTDLDGDGYRDLATINEDSGDVRVFMNLADGSGLFDSMLAPQDIGDEASPNEPGDFDNDGKPDLSASATTTHDVWVMLGAGDGTFSSVTGIDVGGAPHGIVVLDVDGDADPDIVNANVGSNDLALLINDGTGTFTGPTYFEGGVNGEYGLAAADMNGDGITDLVVGGRDGNQINTMLGNGNGTFTVAGPAQASGGLTWVVVLGDVNGDHVLDAAAANDGSGNIGVLIGNGDGTFDAPTLVPIGPHVPSVDLGDLDGDGDLDMLVSSFGGGFWRQFANDGTGAFSFVHEYTADDSPSCSILLDTDNDGDLDMALTDELADTVTIMENASAASSCSPAPSACRAPLDAGKSKLSLKNKAPGLPDKLSWKWTDGPATPKADYGTPLAGDDYELCLYENGILRQSWEIPGGGSCGGRPCWRDTATGYVYKDGDLTPDGIKSLKLIEGLLDGAAKITLKGKDDALQLPDLSTLNGVLQLQLQKSSGAPCFGATYTAPFRKQDSETLLALSDAESVTTTTTSTTTTTLPASWFAIHSQVIMPRCAGCHGGSGGLSGLGDCETAYANLVNVPSTRLPTMDRVEPLDPANSWIMHKLDGTQGSFTAQCTSMFCGSQMPLGGPFLDMATRDAIRTWIQNGAVNDCW